MSTASCRIGQFYLSVDIIEAAPATALTALAGCIVVRAEYVYDRHAIHYTALHDKFDEVVKCLPAPEYTAIMSESGTKRVWMRVT